MKTRINISSVANAFDWICHIAAIKGFLVLQGLPLGPLHSMKTTKGLTRSFRERKDCWTQRGQKSPLQTPGQPHPHACLTLREAWTWSKVGPGQVGWGRHRVLIELVLLNEDVTVEGLYLAYEKCGFVYRASARSNRTGIWQRLFIIENFLNLFPKSTSFTDFVKDTYTSSWTLTESTCFLRSSWYYCLILRNKVKE